MILRRFMQHVKDQNWFAVGLDVVVVIVGIFLGMQVTEWSDGRKQLENDTIFLSQLNDDLLLIKSSLLGAQEAHKWHLNNGLAALSALAGGQITDENRQSVEDGILVIYQLPFPRTKLGNFGLLLDRQVSIPTSNEGTRKRLIEFIDEMSFRLQVYDHIKLSVDASLSVLTTRVAGEVSGDPVVPYILDIDALRGDSKFIASLQNIVFRHKSSDRQIELMIEQIDQFLGDNQ